MESQKFTHVAILLAHASSKIFHPPIYISTYPCPCTIYHPIPQPRAYGPMIVTAPSRRANRNEQPRRRDPTPRRDITPRRTASPPRPPVVADNAALPEPPKSFAPYKALSPMPTPAPYDQFSDPWNEPTPVVDRPASFGRPKAPPTAAPIQQ